MTDTTETDPIWDTRNEALDRASISILYHQKRERFFELADKLSKAATLLLGSATLLKVANKDLVESLAVGVTFTSALSLVFSFSERSKKHAELAQGFRMLSSEIMAKGANVEEDDANGWMSKILVLEVKEPPALSSLVILCQNELAIAKGAKDYVVAQGFWRRCFCHFFDMPLPTKDATKNT
jgi:hypothetical protein